MVFDRATARGEARGGVEGAAVPGVLAGAVFYRVVILHQPCPPRRRDLVVDLALDGLAD